MSLTLTTPGRFLDDFNRADGALGANWTADIGLAPQVVSNMLGPAASDTAAEYFRATGAGTIGDTHAEVKIVSTTNIGDPLVCVRVASAAFNDMYVAYAHGSGASSALDLYRRDAGAWVSLATNTFTQWTIGDTFGLEVTGSGATVVCKLFRNGSQVGSTYNDTAATRKTAAGYVGIRLQNVATARFDDFLAYSLSTTTMTVTNLPTGWKASVGGTTYTESSGTATITGLAAGTSYTVHVFDAADNEVTTQAGGYPGDTWAFHAVIFTNAPNGLLGVLTDGTTSVAATSSGGELALPSGGISGTLAAHIYSTPHSTGLWSDFIQPANSKYALMELLSYAPTDNVPVALPDLPDVTVNATNKTAIAVSWQAVAGATAYTLYRRGHKWTAPHDLEKASVLYTGTGTSYTDTDLPDGRVLYCVVATVSGSPVQSADVAVDLAQNTAPTPNERYMRQFFDPNRSLVVTNDLNTTPGEDHWSYWMEDCGQVLWPWSYQRAFFSVAATALKTALLGYIGSGGTPLVRKVTGFPVGYKNLVSGEYLGDNTYWTDPNGSTTTAAWVAQWAVSTDVLFTFKGSYGGGTLGNTLGQFNLKYIIGGTTYTLNAPTTKTVTWDTPNDKCTIVLGKTTGSVAVTFTIVIQKGLCTVAFAYNNSGATATISANVSLAGGPSTQSTITTGRWLANYGTTDGSATSVLVQRVDATMASPANYVYQVDYGSVTGMGGTTLAKLMFGDYMLPSKYAEFTTDFTDAELGNGFVPAYVAAGLTAWVCNNTTDTAAKTALDNLLGVLYAARAVGYAPDRNQAWLLWCYTRLAAVWPANTTYTTNRDALATVIGGWTTQVTTLYAAGECALALNAYGDTVNATRILGRFSVLASTDTKGIAAYWLGRPDKTATAALNELSWLCRNNRTYMGSTANTIMQAPVYNVANTYENAVTETMSFFLAAMSQFGADHGGVTLCRLGRTSVDYLGDGGGPYSDGTITAHAWDAVTRVFTITCDKDVWLHLPTGAPTYVKSGGVDMTAAGSDPGVGVTTAGEYWYDANTGVLKIGLTSSAVITVLVPAVSIALTTANVDTQGCDLSWTQYVGIDYTSMSVYRSTQSGIDGNFPDVLLTVEYDPAVYTYHDTGASPGTTYYYRVKLVTTGGSVWSNEETVVTPPAGAFFFRHNIIARCR